MMKSYHNLYGNFILTNVLFSPLRLFESQKLTTFQSFILIWDVILFSISNLLVGYNRPT